MKIDIWGIGVRGKIFLSKIDMSEVETIIDNNSTLWGTTYLGVPVLSPTEYLTKKTKNIVIITMKEMYISAQKELSMQGIVSYCLSEMYDEFMSFMSYVRMNDICDCISKYKRVVIVGNNVILPLLANRLRLYNKSLELYVKGTEYNDFDDLQLDFLGVKQVHKVNEDDIVLNITKDNVKVECASIDLWGLDYSKLVPRDDKISKLKNKHLGQKCFIVAVGPSLLVSDLDALKSRGIVTFSCNSIHKIYDKTEWRPDYYMVSDSKVALENREYIESKDCVKKFVSDVCFNREWMDAWDGYFWHGIQAHDISWVSEDFTDHSCLGGTIVFDGALQLAFYMGFKEIYLLGVDCNYIKGSQSNYFFDTAQNDLEDHKVYRMIQAFEVAREYADNHGINIYNATRGGMLEVFLRKDFDDLMDNWEEEGE